MTATPDLTLDNAKSFFGALFGGAHHIPSAIRDKGGGRWSVSARAAGAGLATFDSDMLTQLVLLAHERSIRAAIFPSGPGRVRISITQRDRGSASCMSGHATIEEAIVRFRCREHDWRPTWRRRAGVGEEGDAR